MAKDSVPYSAYGLHTLTHERLRELMGVLAEDENNLKEIIVRRLLINRKAGTTRTYIGLWYKDDKRNISRHAYSKVYNRVFLEGLASRYNKGSILQVEGVFYKHLKNDIKVYDYLDRLVLEANYIGGGRYLDIICTGLRDALQKEFNGYSFSGTVRKEEGKLDRAGVHFEYVGSNKNGTTNWLGMSVIHSKYEASKVIVNYETSYGDKLGFTLTSNDLVSTRYQNLQEYEAFKGVLYRDIAMRVSSYDLEKGLEKRLENKSENKSENK